MHFVVLSRLLGQLPEHHHQLAVVLYLLHKLSAY
jgi:hypothetical protein